MTVKLLKGGLWRGFGGARLLGGSSAPPGPVLPRLSPWVMQKAGGMDIASSTVSGLRVYSHRIYNLDPEPIPEIVFEMASISADAAPVIGMAISMGGSANNPGPGGWHRVTFNGGDVGAPFGAGTRQSPWLLSTDPRSIPGDWQPNQSMVIRYGVASGRWTYATRTRADEINWPNVNLGRSTTTDCVSTDELLAINPTWSSLNLGTSWYAIRTRRATPVVHIVTHGDSVNMGSRGTSSTSGYGWHMRLNALAAGKYFVSSFGHGGTNMDDAEARNPNILARHAPNAGVLMFPTWSGNGSPVSVADCDRIKTNILNAEIQAAAAGLKFWVVTLKPHGATISTAGEIEAYWHMVAWATERYGVRHIDLSSEPTLSADGGLTLLNSADGVHFDGNGQQAQAVAMQPRIVAALAAEGIIV